MANGNSGTELYLGVWKITPALRPLMQDVVGNVGNVLWVVMGTIGVVLLIACANVMNLLLVRSERRRPELAVRAALGAGAWRIIRTLLIESSLLGIAGGALGVAFAYGALRLIKRLAPATSAPHRRHRAGFASARFHAGRVRDRGARARAHPGAAVRRPEDPCRAAGRWARRHSE